MNVSLNRTIRIAAILLILSTITGVTRADEGALLARYSTRLQEHNPQLAAARQQTAAVHEAVTTARALPSPRLSFNKGFGDMDWHYELAATQQIPWPGKLIAATGAATYRAQAADARYNDLQNNLLAMLRNAYARLYAANMKIRLLRKNTDYLKQAREITTAAYATGSQPQTAVLKLQLEEAVEQDRIDRLLTTAGMLREELGALLNLPADSITMPETLPELPVPGYDSAITISLERNPAVTALKLDLNASGKMTGSAKQGLMPDLTVGAKYEPVQSGGGNWHLLTGISVPIWYNTRLAAIRTRRHMEQAAHENLRNGLAALRAETGALHRAYTDAVRRIALHDTSLIPLAEQSLAAIEANYRTGTVDVTALLDALRMLVTLQIQRVDLLETRERMAAEIVLSCLGRVVNQEFNTKGTDHENE